MSRGNGKNVEQSWKGKVCGCGQIVFETRTWKFHGCGKFPELSVRLGQRVFVVWVNQDYFVEPESFAGEGVERALG